MPSYPLAFLSSWTFTKLYLIFLLVSLLFWYAATTVQHTFWLNKSFIPFFLEDVKPVFDFLFEMF